MANIIKQEYVQFDRRTVGLHRVQVTGAGAETFTVPQLENDTAGASIAALRRQGQAAPTVTSSGFYTASVTGVAGEVYQIVTFHPSGSVVGEDAIDTSS